MPRSDGYISKVYGRRRRHGVAAKNARAKTQANNDWFGRSFVYPSDTRPWTVIQKAVDETQRMSVVELDRNLLWMVNPEDVVEEHGDSLFVVIPNHEVRLRGMILVRDLTVAILMAFYKPYGTFKTYYKRNTMIFRFGDIYKAVDKVSLRLFIGTEGLCERMHVIIKPKPVGSKGVLIKITRAV